MYCYCRGHMSKNAPFIYILVSTGTLLSNSVPNFSHFTNFLNVVLQCVFSCNFFSLKNVRRNYWPQGIFTLSNVALVAKSLDTTVYTKPKYNHYYWHGKLLVCTLDHYLFYLQFICFCLIEEMWSCFESLSIMKVCFLYRLKSVRVFHKRKSKDLRNADRHDLCSRNISRPHWQFWELFCS